jgi:hypothetical protein
LWGQEDEERRRKFIDKTRKRYRRSLSGGASRMRRRVYTKI